MLGGGTQRPNLRERMLWCSNWGQGAAGTIREGSEPFPIAYWRCVKPHHWEKPREWCHKVVWHHDVTTPNAGLPMCIQASLLLHPKLVHDQQWRDVLPLQIKGLFLTCSHWQPLFTVYISHFPYREFKAVFPIGTDQIQTCTASVNLLHFCLSVSPRLSWEGNELQWLSAS